MAFKTITIMDLWDIVRRYLAGHNISSISEALGYDRKTIRKYVSHLRTHGITPGAENLDKEHLLQLLKEIATDTTRPADKQCLLEPYLDHLRTLIVDRGLKPKTAFRVLSQQHELTTAVSYTTFKRFLRRHQSDLQTEETVSCRIEVEPGSQLQVDYFKAGLQFDPALGRKRTLYGFLATLSYSRHKYVEFTFRQDQQSFVQSHIRAFNFFGGVPHTIVPDNLKTGVITPSLYDPQFNRAYREMAEYYGCFLDPARVARPRDKGKVERDVQTVREVYKELVALDQTISLETLNQKVLHWLCHDYGLRRHGTTGEQPYQAFRDQEQPRLSRLPVQPFEVAVWREATVHPDCYIQVQKHSYSIPYAYVGKTVWVKITEKTIQVYFKEQLIKQHPLAHSFRQTDPKDFPPNLAAALDRGLPQHLQREAATISAHFARLVRSVLQPHAFRNLRRAQGIVALAKQYPPALVHDAARQASPEDIRSPKHFRRLLDHLQTLDAEHEQALILPISDDTQSFVRSITYFDHTEGKTIHDSNTTTDHPLEIPETLRHGCLAGASADGSRA